VVLHAHGGGFIALSSSTMESYTRRWANSLKVPVISIDYGKPPLHTFPEPVHDMLTVYRFVTEQLSKYCNINPVNIVLAGDSAGGNLMCSLMGLIIKLNLKMPKGIFLAYPACDLRKIYSPSRIHSFSDAILHPPLLLLCLK
jgi:hormone-sensitive lipase